MFFNQNSSALHGIAFSEKPNTITPYRTEILFSNIIFISSRQTDEIQRLFYLYENETKEEKRNSESSSCRLHEYCIKHSHLERLTIESQSATLPAFTRTLCRCFRSTLMPCRVYRSDNILFSFQHSEAGKSAQKIEIKNAS